MTQDLVKASNTLFHIVSTLEPKLLPLKDWYFQTLRVTAKWHDAEGNQGVKRMKSILQFGLQVILGYHPEPLAFVKAVDGLPVLVKPLVDRVNHLTKDWRVLSGVLSFVRMTDFWLGCYDNSTIDEQLEVIEKSALPASAKKVITEFEEFVVEVLNTRDNPVSKALWHQLKLSDSDKVGLSFKRGPNGALTENAHRDYVTNRNVHTKDGRTFGEAITDLQSLIATNVAGSSGSWRTIDDWEKIPSEDIVQDLGSVSPTPGKISFISEKSGKVRLVASPDYFTQMSMKPMHKWLESVLLSIPEDCTFDQRKSVNRIKQWHKDGRSVYSFDQSSCTDLFPVEMQVKVIQKRFGKPLAEAVRTVMCDREWSVKYPKSKTRKMIRWGVGQPMGVYGSWPLMAVTHHLLVQYAAWISSGKKLPWIQFHDYVICGDDIVIGSKSVADCYLRLVKDLGMKINLQKSFISGGKTGIAPVSEFAKLLIWKGQLLVPIKPNQIHSATKDWRLWIPLLIELGSPVGWSVRLKKLRTIVQQVPAPPWGKKVLDYLLTVPLELGGVGKRDSLPLSVKLWQKDKPVSVKDRDIHPWLYALASRIRSKIRLDQSLISENAATLSEDVPSVEVFRTHPFIEWMTNKKKSDWAGPLGGRVPTSVNSFVRSLITDGYRGTLSYLTGEIEISPPTNKPNQDAEESKHLTNIWLKAIGKKKLHSLNTFNRRQETDSGFLGNSSLVSILPTEGNDGIVGRQASRILEALRVLRTREEV